MLGNLIFPNVCGFCGQKIEYGHICIKCLHDIKYYGLTYFPFNQNMNFDELYCNYLYDGVVRSKILEYKFSHKRYLCKTFAEGMIYRFQKIKPEFDLIIPVPIHRSRMKERGYNQSELIAKIVAKKIGIKYDTKILVKLNKNKKQSKLTKDERIKNVRGIFEVRNSNRLKSKAILLIDDIYTTGATVNECSKVLKKAGATDVFVYTVAKATINSHID